ncbi:MAG TPA: enolase C-terminal domain-like protein, partial [bacterium]|nr:enolase C-terminal domain-like protein [bacterium]
MRTRQVNVPLPQPFYPAWAPDVEETQLRLVYVRIDTDADVYGIAGHQFFGAEEDCVARIATYLVGEDPLRLEKHGATLRYLWPSFGAAVWFIEVALWDILGKVARMPIYKLLGNARDKVVAYADTGQNLAPARRASDARRLRDEGFRAIKLRIRNDTLEEDVALVGAVRKAVGDQMAIMVDANQTDTSDAPVPGPQWTYHRALHTAKALAEYGVEWLEEPLPRHAYAELQRLHDTSPIPIAGGNSNQRF